MWYLIFIHDSGNVYVHEYKTKEEALKEYKPNKLIEVEGTTEQRIATILQNI